MTSQSRTLELSLTELAELLGSGALSAKKYAEAVIFTANENSTLNAFVTFDETALRQSAESADQLLARGNQPGMLHGVPLILKDNINTRALPTSGGTPALRDNRTDLDAPVAERLFAAGALLAGKANLHELSSGGTSNNHTFGTVANPYDTLRTPGGSSGGTAAAIAARVVPAGLGTDTAGSVRVPAALCGVVGLKPTTGRYPGAGIVPISRTFDTAGPIARSVADVSLLDAMISGDPVRLPGTDIGNLRLGVPFESHVAAASTQVTSVFSRALERIERAGAEIVPVNVSEIQDLTKASIVMEYEFPIEMKRYLRNFAPGVTMEALADDIASPSVRGLTLKRLARTPDSTAYRETMDTQLPRLRAAHAELHKGLGIDALVYPTTKETALPSADDDNVFHNGESISSWLYFKTTALASVAGNPSLTLPCGLSADGLPVGILLDSLPGRDRELLAIGRTLEQVIEPVPPPGPPRH